MSTIDEQHVTVDRVRDLLDALEQGDAEAAGRKLDELTRLRETVLFREMGSLTRELHEALTALDSESAISKIAAEHFPDTKERLAYVVSKTEEAAHKTLSLVEDAMPVATGLRERGAALHGEWTEVGRNGLPDDVSDLAGRTAVFLEALDRDAAALNDKLSEVLMAQDFQDLTGQVLRRAIDVVQEVEDRLVGFIRDRGAVETTGEGRGDNTRGHGPRVGDGPAEEYVNGQGDVDDLLSSLGF